MRGQATIFSILFLLASLPALYMVSGEGQPGNTTIAAAPLKAVLRGGIEPGEEYVASLTAEASHNGLFFCAASSGVIVESGGHSVTAGINFTLVNHIIYHTIEAHLVIMDGDTPIVDEKIDEIGPGTGKRYYATVSVRYGCDGGIVVSLEAGGQSYSYRFQGDGVAKIYAVTGESSAPFAGCESEVSGTVYEVEDCQTTTVTNPYGDPSGSQRGDEESDPSIPSQALVYAAAAAAGLALLLAVAMPKRSGVVVVGKRGLAPLLVAVLLALGAGAALAFFFMPKPRLDAPSILAAVAALLLFLLLLVFLRQSSTSQVVIVER